MASVLLAVVDPAAVSVFVATAAAKLHAAGAELDAKASASLADRITACFGPIRQAEGILFVWGTAWLVHRLRLCCGMPAEYGYGWGPC